MDSAASVPQAVHAWIDPSCPWAWQTIRWLHELRDRSLLHLTYGFFSLELNASPPGTPFDEAAVLYGDALKALALARREEGDDAVERIYLAIGRRSHDAREEMSMTLLRAAAADAGDPELPARATATNSLADELTAEFLEARELNVFGVPTLQIDRDKPIYGPLIALAPTGEDALELWRSTRALSARPDFFELKRWPRDVKPGRRPEPPNGPA